MKISTFIPITNPKTRGDTYIEAIKSHLLFSDELIIVDGGSTDGSIEEIEKLNDPRIKIITRFWKQDNFSWVEFCKAWNAGLAACTGDWVAAGETDHIFHEAEIPRLKNELTALLEKKKATVTINKMQSAQFNKWYSKAKMYYFINKRDFPNVCYGLDKNTVTDLCQPILKEQDFSFMDYQKRIDQIPAGKAIVEHDPETSNLVGGSGVVLYNYLWTFKTYDQVVTERLKSSKAWNNFFSPIDTKAGLWPEKKEKVRLWIKDQIDSVRKKANTFISLEEQPLIMQQKLSTELKDNMIGSPSFNIDDVV